MRRPTLKVIDINDFSGGLNTNDSPGAIADNQLAESHNCYLIGKDVAQRKGYVRYNNSARIDTANAGYGITEAPFTAGDVITAVAGSKIATKGSDTWTDITGSVTLTGTKPVMFTMINNELVGINGTDAPWYYTGTGNATTLNGTNIPSTPTASEEFHGRLFLAEGRKIAWSPYMGDWRNDWSPDSEQYYPSNVTGLKVHGDKNQSALLAFTKDGIHSVYFDASIMDTVGGSGTFRMDHVTNQHGCVSPYSVQECVTDDGTIVIIWADRDGLKAITPDQKIIKLTENIQPDWDNLRLSNIDEAVGIFYKPKRWYILICRSSSSATNDKVIVYDLRNWCVAGIFDWTISGAGIVQSSGVDILVGSDYSGYWNQYDSSYTDNGTTIDSYFKTKTFDGGFPHYDKAFRSVMLSYAYFGKYSFDITAFLDHTGSCYTATHTAKSGATLDDFVLDQDVLGEEEQLSISSEELKGRGRMIQLKIGNNESGETYRIHRAIINFHMSQMRMYN